MPRSSERRSTPASGRAWEADLFALPRRLDAEPVGRSRHGERDAVSATDGIAAVDELDPIADERCERDGSGIGQTNAHFGA